MAEIKNNTAAPVAPLKLERSYGVIEGESFEEYQERRERLNIEHDAMVANKKAVEEEVVNGSLACPMPKIGDKNLDEEEEPYVDMGEEVINFPAEEGNDYAEEADRLAMPPPAPGAPKKKKKKRSLDALVFGEPAPGAPKPKRRRKKITAVVKNFGNGDKRVFELTLPDGTIVLARELFF